MAASDPHFRLRLPADLHDRLTQEAQASERSINAEVVFRLRQSLAQPASKTDEVDRHILRIKTEIIQAEQRMVRSQHDLEQLKSMLSEAMRLRKIAEETEQAEE